MSHGHERKEKNCLNCNARVFGRYCHVCGQENIEPKESAFGLITHFFNDITHFEGKFITSLRYILFRPGFLAKEYERGRRASYMNPVRMYVFTSAFFFIVFFSLFKVPDEDVAMSYNKLEERLKNSNANFNVNFVTGNITVDKVVVGNIKQMEKVNDRLIDSIANAAAKKDTASTAVADSTEESGSTLFNFGKRYTTVGQYDSVQQTLPAAERDGWLGTQLNRKVIYVNNKYSKSPGLAYARIFDVFLHKLPTILFISLPLFALILSLLYIRRRQYNYVNHAIFSIYYYIFCFLTLLIYFGTDKLSELTHWRIFSWLEIILFLSFYVYLYKAMRHYYLQGRAKTILKYMFLNFVFLFVIIFLFAGFFIFSALNI
ncbi:DUF3667 domain-containing protein [Lacibacter luteus]|uniref:DUF3667 domain-containing protein n=1 Tax=Lacibacter luteus TaxID=2508719 RepID=A0A4Q1CFG1_9BACT|nr:DUF3667 domain-containing protein [Lacibacter luteus]RXK58423.1 DUF3667 domain-containing protein [Lacibacter luteus]